MENIKKLIKLVCIVNIIYASILFILGLIGVCFSSPIAPDTFLGGLTVVIFYLALIVFVYAIIHLTITILLFVFALKQNPKLTLTFLIVLIAILAILAIVSFIAIFNSGIGFMAVTVFYVIMLIPCVLCLVKIVKIKAKQITKE